MNAMGKKKILSMIQYAYNHIPYYNNIFNGIMDDKCYSDISQIKVDDIPTFNKGTIKTCGWDNFIDASLRDCGTVPMTAERTQRSNYVIERTSGTTGEAMDIVWNAADLKCSLSAHWAYRLRRFGVTPSDRFFTSELIKNSTDPFIIRNNAFVFNSTRYSYDIMRHTIDAICEFKPKWFLCAPSVLYLLIRYANAMNKELNFRINGIELFSEPSIEHYTSYIKKHINAPIINMYGCTETNGIAYSCEFGNLHVMENNVYFEILNKANKTTNNGEGKVCITGLHNRGMPIIKYVLDDTCKYVDMCRCGKKIVELTNSRLPTVLLLDDNSICCEGQVIYPLKKFPEFPIYADDIILRLKRISLSKYVVIVPSAAGRLIDDIIKVLSNVMTCYGIVGINLEVVQSDCNEGVEGLLRIL
jgi:phenylacetate-coenzyme A ligase PaaK-like adenylate-forming protein